ncbi:MAG: hypothetical protein ABIR77_03565, partial [Sphingomicrobium sp.]
SRFEAEQREEILLTQERWPRVMRLANDIHYACDTSIYDGFWAEARTRCAGLALVLGVRRKREHSG